MNTSCTEQLEKARFNMIEQQIRPWEVTDKQVIDALFQVKRECFVPPVHQSSTFMDIKVPLEIDGQDTQEYMLEPKIEARLLQELHLKDTDNALEIGTGSGYQAALMAQLCHHVTSVEIHTSLAEFARHNLAQQHINNVTVVSGDAHQHWGNEQYDAILVTGSLPSVPTELSEQLKDGGRLVAIVGQGPAMSVVRITRQGTSLSTESLFETNVQLLQGVHVSKFNF